MCRRHSLDSSVDDSQDDIPFNPPIVKPLQLGNNEEKSKLNDPSNKTSARKDGVTPTSKRTAVKNYRERMDQMLANSTESEMANKVADAVTDKSSGNKGADKLPTIGIRRYTTDSINHDENSNSEGNKASASNVHPSDQPVGSSVSKVRRRRKRRSFSSASESETGGNSKNKADDENNKVLCKVNETPIDDNPIWSNEMEST